jgi:hypothetical protein
MTDVNATLNNSNTATNQSGTIITIKQESLTNVDNLVGSFVDSTTFLPSPNNNNSAIGNAHISQNNSMTNEATGINEGSCY